MHLVSILLSTVPTRYGTRWTGLKGACAPASEIEGCSVLMPQVASLYNMLSCTHVPAAQEQGPNVPSKQRHGRRLMFSLQCTGTWSCCSRTACTRHLGVDVKALHPRMVPRWILCCVRPCPKCAAGSLHGDIGHQYYDVDDWLQHQQKSAIEQQGAVENKPPDHGQHC